MKLGSWTLPPFAMLAPMAGVSDRALRELAMREGAVACVGEMVSCKGLVQGSRKSAELMEIGEREMPCAIQLFGDEAEPMARAAELAQQYSPAWLDINMGCPAPKIAGNRSGSALMLDPERAESIIRAGKKASSIPVTVKFRKGWDDSHINAVEFAKMAEAAGADAVTVHGRTRQQMYAPPVDWEIIRQVKNAVSIPVIGNGDVVSPETAKALYETTGCDLVMVGRASYGNPWIFQEIDAACRGIPYTPPTVEELIETMLLHIRMILETGKGKPEPQRMKEARKHAAWYLHGLRGAAGFRSRCYGLDSYQQAEQLARDVLAMQEQEDAHVQQNH